MAMTHEEKNLKALDSFVSGADKKLIGIVGIHALAVLAGMMKPKEFDAFIHDSSAIADKEHVDYLNSTGERKLSQKDINHLMNTRSFDPEKSSLKGDTIHVVGHDGTKIGKFKSKVPLLRNTGA